MTMLPQHGLMVGDSDVLIPTDKTKTYTALSTLDENRYYLNSLLHQNPKDKRIVIHTFGDGVDHVLDAAKKISYRLSSDRGATFGAKATLYDPVDGIYQIQDPGIGIDRKGRLHIMADCHTAVGSTGGLHELRYMYSDDNGATVSSPVVITLPTISGFSGAFRMYGRIIDTGSTLIAPCYFAKDEGDSSESARYVVRSTDYGDNWSFVLVEGPTTEYINESECLAITQNIVIMVSRYEAASVTFMMYKSIDAGATWIRVGGMGTTITSTIAAPCRLHKFRGNDGRWFCVMYFPNKQNDRIYAIYGRLDNGVDAGVGLFNTATLTLLMTDTAILHYGDFLHYNGNLNARGAWAREAGTFPFDNQMLYFENVSTQYDGMIASVGPQTIYDKLAVPMFISTWRGLVSNTTNSWGVVNVSSQVTTWKSIAPGPLAQDFTAAAGGIVLDSDGVTFDGTKALTHGTSTYWNFLSYSGAGESDINFTIYVKIKLGTLSNPNAFYGIFGNNAGSASNKGMYMAYDDRAAVPASDRMSIKISKGSAGFIVSFDNDNVITPNAFHVICMEVDLSQATTNNKVKLYVDGVTISTTVAAYNTGISSPPTYNMQIGAIGNNGGIMTGTIKDVVIQNAIDISSVRTNFTQALIDAT